MSLSTILWITNFAQDLDAFSERILLVTNKLLNLDATIDQSQDILGKEKEVRMVLSIISIH